MTTKYPKRSPLEAIRIFCVWCQGGSFQGVEECADLNCPFYPYRHGAALEKGKHSPVRACRAYCSEYCLPGSSREDVNTCGGDCSPQGPCPVFSFRMGTNPNKSKPLSDKRRAALVEAGKIHRFQTGQKPPFTASESIEKCRSRTMSHSDNPGKAHECLHLKKG